MFINKASPPQLVVFSNSDWADNVNDRTSTSVFIIYLGGTPLCWSLKKWKTIARSSTEVEFRAIAVAVSKLTWIQSIL